jgi:4-hydroxythreonine-4-phosphate dehydrogenase
VTFELVVATGDPQGIGPEVSVGAVRRALSGGLAASCLLVGDPGVLERAGAASGMAVLPVPLPLGLREPPPSEAGGRAALAVLEAALARVREDPARRALVTAPVSKTAVRLAAPDFDGHTGWLAARLGAKEAPVMMFAAPGFRVALATVHVPLGRVPGLVTAERLRHVVRVVRADLARRFGIPDARIDVLGLNPHAGEAGGIGKEEVEVIAPAVAALRNEGVRISGPHPADSYFRPGFERGCDAVIAWYHDQGLLPVKCLAFGEAVNVTLGLPIVRTSVDHGTAFDRAGRGEADPGSMHCALRLALELLCSPDSHSV